MTDMLCYKPIIIKKYLRQISHFSWDLGFPSADDGGDGDILTCARNLAVKPA